MEKAVAYLRVSGNGQVEGDGFRRQEEAIKGYCQKHKLNLVQTFKEEGVSGTKDESERPAFMDMVNKCLSEDIKFIIIERLDRLARDIKTQSNLIFFLGSKQLFLISADTEENIVEAMTSDPMKKAMIQIQGVFAELEKNLLVKKLKAARQSTKEKEGKCEGRKTIKESNPKLVEILKSLYRKPRNGKRMTLQAMANQLNSEGVKTPSDREWSRANLHSALKSLNLI